jgi:hypothetical protein
VKGYVDSVGQVRITREEVYAYMQRNQ